MDYCSRIKGVVYSDDFKQGYRTLVRLSCKMWECPYCGPRNAIQWKAYLLHRFNETMRDEKWCFLTITAHKNAHKTPRLSLKNLQQVWKKLYDRLLRRFYPKGANGRRKGMEYVRVFEQHLSGRYHMHILLNCGEEYDKEEFVIKGNLDEYRHPCCRWLRVACAQLGGGWRVHIRRVWEERTKTANVGLVVGYILKYMGKQMHLLEFPKHQRRIQTSRRIGSPAVAKVGQGTWTHTREIPLSMLRSIHLPILDYSTGEVLQEGSFEGEAYYPPIRYYNGGRDIT
jgi:hypothetical protein